MSKELQKTIFISAFRSISIRYILYSDIFTELKKNNYKFVVFIKKNDIPYYKKKFNDKNIIFEPVKFKFSLKKLKGNHISLLFMLGRTLIYGSKKNVINHTAKEHRLMLKKRMTTLRLKAEYLLLLLISFFANKSSFLRKLYIKIESFFFPGKWYDEYFKKYKPDALIISSLGYMIDCYMIRAAKRHKCKTISIVHSWDNPTTKDYRGATPDHVIVWNKEMKKEVNIFQDLPNNIIFEGGIAHWDFYFNNKFIPLPKKTFFDKHSLSPEKTTIFYGSSSYKMFPNTFDVVEFILESIKNNKLCSSSQLLFRFHPIYLMKNEKGEQIAPEFKKRAERIKDTYGDLICFNYPQMTQLNDDIDMSPEDMQGLANILFHSDIVITEYSTLMIEAAIFDKPIINAAIHNYRDTPKPLSYLEEVFVHIQRIIKTGAVKKADTHERLIELLNSSIKNPSLNQKNRKFLKEQEAGIAPGFAGINIGKHITEIIEETHNKN